MSTGRPGADYLLLDVDGVLNAFLGPGSSGAFEKRFMAKGFKMLLPAGSRKWVEQLEQHFTIVWCTTWQAEAAGMLAPHFGFGAGWDFVPLELDGRYDTIKLPSVRRWISDNLEADDRFAWIDDDLADDARSWASVCGYPNILLAPSPETGWTRSDVDELVAFSSSESSGEELAEMQRQRDGEAIPDDEDRMWFETVFGALVGADPEQAEMWIARLSDGRAARRGWADAVMAAAAADPEMVALGEFARVADAMVDSPYRRWTIQFLKDLSS